MEVKIDGLHEKALLRLMQHNNEKTGIGMVRTLIRDTAKQAGVWQINQDDDSECVTEQASDPVPAS